ncbi:DUF4234 domain-containing protein [Paraconexibacter algicola]|uniref:DUF4234 domain-containing protein n=1 Tax=Paraconexibacter algicola TaxID=2133960 RepID=A0A2T4UIR4_9ACTN|nr:DUF4234 domain-containing protein [Paraconexibacter algicola]PTL59119.1 hypothetical protein C7Y72_05380 [Paraconexibacter algicola]
MAENVQIAGSGEDGRVRNPLGVIGLTLITLGIYGIVWYYKVNKELAAIGRAKGTEEAGTSPVTSVLAVTLGALVIVPAVVSMFRTWKRLNVAEGLVGREPDMSAPVGFVLMFLLGPVGTYFFQRNLNRVLQAQAA